MNKEDFEDNNFDLNHFKNLKSIKFLKLAKPLNDGNQLNRITFICPLTSSEMNGLVPFVFLWSCGCVFAKKIVGFIKDSKCPVVILLNFKHQDSVKCPTICF